MHPIYTVYTGWWFSGLNSWTSIAGLGDAVAVAVFQGTEQQPNRTLKSSANGTAPLPHGVLGVVLWLSEILFHTDSSENKGNNIKRPSSIV